MAVICNYPGFALLYAHRHARIQSCLHKTQSSPAVSLTFKSDFFCSIATEEWVIVFEIVSNKTFKEIIIKAVFGIVQTPFLKHHNMIGGKASFIIFADNQGAS